MLSKLTSSINQFASGFKKAVTSIFWNIEEETSFEADLSPRRPSERTSRRNIIRHYHFPHEEIYENILEAQTPEKNPSLPLNQTPAQQKSSGENTEMTFGMRGYESSQRQADISHNTASFKRYDSSYEMLTQQFARISPQVSQIFTEKVNPIRVINYWKKIYKEQSGGSLGKFTLNLDMMMPLPIKSEWPNVEFRYNGRTKTYEVVRRGLKRRYSDISLTESATSLESDVKDSEQLILKKPKLENSLQRERRQPLNFQSRRKLSRKVENLRFKINL